jgi:predicted ATP-dependent serine protease
MSTATISLEDIKAPIVKRASGMDLGLESRGPQKLGDVHIPEEYYNRISTGLEALDNLFNNFVPGMVVTVGAGRGAGKTTLLLQLAQAINVKYKGKVKTLFSTNEEAIEQLAFTAERIGSTDVDADNISTVEDVIAIMPKYRVLCVDSLAGLHTSNTEINKSDVEVYAIQQIYKAAKVNKCIVFLVQHMCKGGKLAMGKTAVEHTADACIKIFNLEEEDFGPGAKKIVVDKNRFGGSGELLIRMSATGFDLENPIADCSSRENQDGRAKGAVAGGQRAEQKVRETNNLLDFIKAKGQITEKDLGTWDGLPDDPTAFDRQLRLIKSLVKMGKLIRLGDKIEAAK